VAPYRAIIVFFISCFVGLFSALAECQTLRPAAFNSLPAIQAQAPAAPGQTARLSKLNVNVIEGGGAINNVTTRPIRELTVEVDDQNDHPVPGAMVTFFVPSQGAGGSFAGDSQLLTVMTDTTGRAVVNSFRPNATVGDFKIEVTATYSDQTATASISQSNQKLAAAPVASRHSGKTIGILAAVGAAVAVGVAVGLSHGGSSPSTSSSTQTATIGVGNGATVGSPH